MNKKISSCIKLQIPSQNANPSPPIGPALGQKGLNIIEFCKEFNNKTLNIEKGLIVSVLITVYIDKTFSFLIKSSPTSILIKKILGIEKGSKTPGKSIITNIDKNKIYEIIEIKKNDMTGYTNESMFNCIKGTAKSMGIKVI